MFQPRSITSGATHAGFSPRSARSRSAGPLALLAAWLGVLLAAPASEALGQLVPKEKPVPARGLEIQNRLGEQVPGEISVIDESGNAITFGSLLNQPGAPTDGGDRTFTKPLVVLMVYFSCPLQCPQTLEGLGETLSKVDYTVGHEYDVAVVSFDPRDKPLEAERQKQAMLLSYNRPTSDRVRDGWRFLTTPPADARRLADSLGFTFRYLPEAGEFSHPTVVYVLTPEGRVSRQFNGVKFPTKDFRFALLEASNGRIGDTFDQFTFWCYHFDPESGSYTLQAMRIMQLGGGVTVVALGGLLASLMLHERRKVRRAMIQAAGEAQQRASRLSAPATTTVGGRGTGGQRLDGQRSDGQRLDGHGLSEHGLAEGVIS